MAPRRTWLQRSVHATWSPEKLEAMIGLPLDDVAKEVKVRQRECLGWFL